MQNFKLFFGNRGVAVVGAVLGLTLLSGCSEIRRTLLGWFAPDAAEEEARAAATFSAKFTSRDKKRRQIKVKLLEVARGLALPTDAQMVPETRDRMLVLEKDGLGKVVNLVSGKQETVLKVKVANVSEQGLLGVAFHPRFVKNRRFFLHHTNSKGDKSVIAEWRWPKKGSPARVKQVLAVGQPYQNHNAGQIAFGPDGYLYVGMGDGGWADDRHGHGQNTKSLLGAMLRLDVDAKGSGGAGYRVPSDNPFVGRKNVRPEIYAIGLRNPWRYTFDQFGRLVVADVGQNLWEEVTFVEPGDNLGWNVFEGFACFSPEENCAKKRPGRYRAPILAYPREDGTSITGGYEVLAPGALQGKYIFGDYGSGRIWAVDLPRPAPAKGSVSKPKVGSGKERARLDNIADVIALGQWPLRISTFARDAVGRLYVFGMARGTMYRIEPTSG